MSALGNGKEVALYVALLEEAKRLVEPDVCIA